MEWSKADLDAAIYAFFAFVIYLHPPIRDRNPKDDNDLPAHLYDGKLWFTILQEIW